MSLIELMDFIDKSQEQHERYLQALTDSERLHYESLIEEAEHGDL
jgi:hypothetical protein